MMEKIEWYQEVLEIEPSSKVFFPLAKLLSGNNQVQESIAVLRQGLDRHPEFFEARLMLIDLLQQEQETAGALCEVQALGSKLSAYPGFWEAWAGSVSAAGADKDMATALRLMAAFLRHDNLSWSDIINSGLSALTGGTALPEAASDRNSKITAPEPEFEPIQAAVAAIPTDEPFEPQEHIIPEPVDLVADDLPDSIEEPLEVIAPVAPEIPAEFTADEDEGDDEQFSLRTKTMATVLAEQGDYAGAKEIYEEILAATTDSAVRADLEGRIADLVGKIKSGHAAAAPDNPDEASDQGKNKLIQVLERLAGRLETRADKL